MRAKSAPSGRPGRRRALRRARSRSARLAAAAVGAACAAALASGCATTRDLHELRSEVRLLDARQDSALRELARSAERARAEALDSVAALSGQLFEFRGDVNNRLGSMWDQLLIIGELVGQSQRSLERMTEELNEQRAQLAERLAAGRTPQDTAQADADPGQEPPPPDYSDEEGEAFAEILAMLDRGSTSTAGTALEQFLQEYPNSDFAPAAYLHLGEIKAEDAAVAENAAGVEDAIQTYMTIPDLYPDAAQVPFALFRAGLLCISIEDYTRARRYLERFLEDYADHVLAPRVQERLDAIP